jgi:hypothetical protein
MDALSSEWRVGVRYAKGDRVAFKLGDQIGAAAFECSKARTSPLYVLLLNIGILRDLPLQTPAISTIRYEDSTYS